MPIEKCAPRCLPVLPRALEQASPEAAAVEEPSPSVILASGPSALHPQDERRADALQQHLMQLAADMPLASTSAMTGSPGIKREAAEDDAGSPKRARTGPGLAELVRRGGEAGPMFGHYLSSELNHDYFNQALLAMTHSWFEPGGPGAINSKTPDADLYEQHRFDAQRWDLMPPHGSERNFRGCRPCDAVMLCYLTVAREQGFGPACPTKIVLHLSEADQAKLAGQADPAGDPAHCFESLDACSHVMPLLDVTGLRLSDIAFDGTEVHLSVLPPEDGRTITAHYLADPTQSARARRVNKTEGFYVQACGNGGCVISNCDPGRSVTQFLSVISPQEWRVQMMHRSKGEELPAVAILLAQYYLASSAQGFGAIVPSRIVIEDVLCPRTHSYCSKAKAAGRQIYLSPLGNTALGKALIDLTGALRLRPQSITWNEVTSALTLSLAP